MCAQRCFTGWVNHFVWQLRVFTPIPHVVRTSIYKSQPKLVPHPARAMSPERLLFVLLRRAFSSTAVRTTRNFAYACWPLRELRTSACLKDFLTSALGLLISLYYAFLHNVKSHKNPTTALLQNWLYTSHLTVLKHQSETSIYLNTTADLRQIRGLPLAGYTTQMIVKCDATKSTVHYRHHKIPQLNPNSMNQSPLQGLLYDDSNSHYTGFNTWIAERIESMCKATAVAKQRYWPSTRPGKRTADELDIQVR